MEYTSMDEFLDDMIIAEESLIEDFNVFEENMCAVIEGAVIYGNGKRYLLMKYGETVKAIKQIVKQARKAKKNKDYDEAIKLYTKAKEGYKGLLASAKKMSNVEVNPSTKFGKESVKGGAKLAAINWCQDKIDDCDAAIDAVKNKMMKDARKAAKKNPASEAVLELQFALEAMNITDDYSEFDF